jgi:hypothetical protein
MNDKIIYIINMILYNSINKIFLLFNRSIRFDIIYKIITSCGWSIKKEYFEITFNKLSKTKDKNIYKIDEKIILYRYNFKNK